MKKLRKKRFVYILVLIIFIAGITLITYLNSDFIKFRDEGNFLFSLENYSKIEVLVNNNDVIFKNKCTAIIVTIPSDRAANIDAAVKNVSETRPSIYDSTLEIINHYNIELGYVKIERLENNVYYSKAIFSTKNKILNLDMRPSDAIILALKLNKPIYINNYLLDEYGNNICQN